MKTIEDYYQEKIKNDLDINEHMPTLKKYASKCDSITEMGVRSIVSTWALLYGQPKKMTSIDIKHPMEYINHDSSGCNLNEVKRIATDLSVEFSFVLGDTLRIDIEPTDLLFIDTYHTYFQLRKELELHAKNVKKYIVLHDTETFGYKDESPSVGIGIFTAVKEFLQENKEWSILEHFSNNNGLTILSK